MLRTTPFHPRTAPLAEGEAWRRWSGYLVASSYELSHEREYHAIRNSAALLDISPLYKYHVRGPDAARLLDRVVTRDARAAEPCQVLYTPWCDSRGKVIDDGTVTRLDEDLFRLTAADPNLGWLHDNARGMRVEIADVSSRIAALALQGPLARAILERAIEADLSRLRFFRAMHSSMRGIAITITRTGYTGDLGYEIWMEASDALPVWDALTEAGAPLGITPAGMLALDVARIEAGLPLIEVDYISARHALIDRQTSTPYELSLGWTVKLEKPAFNGRHALIAEHARGAAWRFVGVEVDWPSLERLFADVGLAPRIPGQAWRTSVPLYARERQVGYATSGTWSPLLKRYIALAHLERAHAEPGAALEMEITVEHRRLRAAATVRKLPFLDLARKRQ